MTITSTTSNTETEPDSVQPVDVSPEAHRALATSIRLWSGWPNARLVIGKPDSTSPYANCDHPTRTFTVNADVLVLNPHRVLRTVTPFRLRQEAVLTGTMLHEAGHARHTLWKPRTLEALAAFTHGDGSPVTNQTFALASLMEEARVEGLQARDENKIGAAGLGWTMRASAAHLIPTTVLNTTIPEQQIMDLITSWTLRAGRQIALANFTSHRIRPWVGQFNSLVQQSIVNFLDATAPNEDESTSVRANNVLSLLHGMMWNEDDRGTYMVDTAREVLAILFPETDGDDENAPMPGGGCEMVEQAGQEEAEQASGENGEPEEGAEEGTGGAQDDEQCEDGAEAQPGADEGSDGGTDEGTESESGGSEVSDASDTGDPESGEPASGEPDSALAEALAAMEAMAASDTEDEAEAEAQKAPASGAGSGAGSGESGFRPPNADERVVAGHANKFMRDLISPDETSTTSLTDAPSSLIDGAAMATWRASGGTRDPHFFIRTRREVRPSPPVKIAVLVDISGSMDVLQEPSALLSWAISSAALDLRNFAGRGQQIESTLIHWGSTAHVVQAVGQTLPGISTVGCWEGTQALPAAMDLVAEQIPGFFEITDHPVNRLLVHFTDWDLTGGQMRATEQIKTAMAAGVNMLSIVPSGYTNRWRTKLPAIMAQCDIQRGRSTVVKYNEARPDQVWEDAAAMLR